MIGLLYIPATACPKEERTGREIIGKKVEGSFSYG